ncbi:SGNH/GDSL hydrolase family protein [Cohnella caldifontis]|uniref:SGNH/GDSL hydrolase family protein n=1 Tax=Cohnella caldifontis TaxID=3027471 RepID=UPI0023EAE7A3|nr:GDSL-type esterase/lipase family protein [Cohnella sp. YIM B05605]
MLAIGFGDSITAGAFVPPEETFLYKLGLQYGFDALNAGVPGNTTSQALERMQTDVLDKRPAICIIQFGMNDHVAVGVDERKVDPGTFEANLRQMVAKLHAIKCVPILCTISPIIEGDADHYYYHRHPREWYLHPPGAQAWIDEYSRIIRQAARDLHVRLADVAEQFACYVKEGGTLDGPEGVLRNLDNAGADDGVHPVASGHDLYAAAITEALDKLEC